MLPLVSTWFCVICFETGSHVPQAFLKEAPHLPITPSTVPSAHLAFRVCKQVPPDRLLGVSPLGKHITNTALTAEALRADVNRSLVTRVERSNPIYPGVHSETTLLGALQSGHCTFLPTSNISATSALRQRSTHTSDPAVAHLPCEDHHEVHDVPAVPEIGALVKHEAQSYDLDARLEAKDADEVRFRVILRRSTGQRSPRSLRKAAWRSSCLMTIPAAPRLALPGTLETSPACSAPTSLGVLI